MLFICIICCLYLFVVCTLTFLCLLTSALSVVFCCSTQWFWSYLYWTSSCTWLGIILFWFQTFITCKTLDMFYIPFIVIVDSWNVNKISISTSTETNHKKPLVCVYRTNKNCHSSTLTIFILWDDQDVITWWMRL